jgi:FkbM family methyltransferase
MRHTHVRTALRKIRRALIPDHLWEPAGRGARAAVRLCHSLRTDAWEIGLHQWIQLERDIAARERVRWVHLPGFNHRVYYRAGTSDPRVLLQIFARREYECVAQEPEVRCVVDCGANIGCTSFFFLHRYPRARVVCVEPDPGNMALCRRNLAPFGDRVTFIQSGVWSSTAPMVVDRGRFGDGSAWSFQVREARRDEPVDFHALTIPDLLRAGGFERVDVLKVDIEAAEAEVFQNADWLGVVRHLVIETHGQECERAVAGAFLGREYELRFSGELTVYKNIRRSGERPSPRDGAAARFVRSIN